MAETFSCYYNVTDKVNEIARQHAEKVAPVLRGWSRNNNITIDFFIAGLSHADVNENYRNYYFRCYHCDKHLDYQSGDIIKWFNTKDEFRAAIAAIADEYAARHGKLVVAEYAHKNGVCDVIRFYGVDEFGKAWCFDSDKQVECPKVVIDPANPTTTDNDGTERTLFLNPADIADVAWSEVQHLVNVYKTYLKTAFDLRRKEIGAGDNILAAIRKAQAKTK